MRADAADGRTIVFATHYLAEADAFADRTVLMARGRIRADGPTAAGAGGVRRPDDDLRPPAHVVGVHGIDPVWLEDVRRAIAPLGITDLEVASASLEAAFLALTEGLREHRPRPRPDRDAGGPAVSTIQTIEAAESAAVRRRTPRPSTWRTPDST